MRRAGRIVSIIAVALVAAVLPLQASAEPLLSAQPTAVKITRFVGSAGTFRVSVALAAETQTPILVRIGAVSTRVAIQRGRGRARLTAHVGGRRLTVRAFGAFGAPHLAVTAIRRLTGLRRTHQHKASPSRHRAIPPATVKQSHTTASPAAPATAAAATPAAGSGASSTAGSPVVPPAGTGATGAAGPPGNAASWQLAFDDEFNGTALDTSKWSTGWMGSGITAPVNPEELQCYDPAQVSEGNGELDLSLIAKTETCGGETRAYASGLIDTDGKFSYTYGYLEARVWVPGNGTIADWPAIWTDGQSWPQDGELDAMEGLGGQACWHFHDPSGGPGGCSTTNFTGGWHTFGADWEPGSVTYYYDGTVVGSVTSGITSSPMFVILDLAADNAYGGPLTAPATLRVDYVRIWQH